MYDYYKSFAERGNLAASEWNKMFTSYSQQFPDLAAELTRRVKKELPKGWKEALPSYTPSDPPVATRKLSEHVLNKIAPMMPELIGGSADLTGSNLTRWKSAVDFQAVRYLLLFHVV